MTKPKEEAGAAAAAPGTAEQAAPTRAHHQGPRARIAPSGRAAPTPGAGAGRGRGGAGGGADLASRDAEMRRALERHNRGQARVLPVLLRSVDYREAPFARLAVVPSSGRAV